MCVAFHNKIEFWLILWRMVLCCIYFLLVMSSSQFLRWSLTCWSTLAPLLVWLPLGRSCPKRLNSRVVDLCWLLLYKNTINSKEIISRQYTLLALTCLSLLLYQYNNNGSKRKNLPIHVQQNRQKYCTFV